MATGGAGRDPGDTPVGGLLIDLDGVVYIGEEIISGADAAIGRLRARGLPLRFVSNTSTKPARDVEAKLARLGIEVRSGEVVTPVGAAISILQERGAKAPYLVVDERVAPEFAAPAPVGVFPEPPARDPDFIVVGDIGRRWDYELMSSLFEMLSKGARLVALHKGRTWQTGSGLALDIGAFVAGLEYASRTEAIVTGKPAPDFFSAALAGMGLAAAQAVMVGDDIDSDIGGAQDAGIRGALVRTGKYRRALAERSAVIPWATIDSIADLDALIVR